MKSKIKIDLVFSPLEISRCTELNTKTSIVIDVLRASSTMIYAFNGYDNTDKNRLKGVRKILPAKDVETARDMYKVKIAQSYLLAGESDGLPPSDFHFGNSPAEFTEDKISGKALIMATTNGTKTINLVMGSKNILIGSFVNAFATARKSIACQKDIIIACAGRWDVSGLEDITCGGLIASYIQDLSMELATPLELSDSVKLAIRTYKSYRSVIDILNDSAHGKYLVKKGLEKDLEPCSAINKFNIVPVYQNGIIIPEVLPEVPFCSSEY